MKILVCVKQVVEAESPVKINDSGKWITCSTTTRFEMNPFDAYAVEEALQIRENISGSMVHALTVGPDHARETLARALGMGVDEAVHIVDNQTGYRSPFVTAAWIAAYARDKGYDLILTGIMSADEMNSQTGPMIGQLLSIPCSTAVIRERIDRDKRYVAVEREIERGARDMFNVRLPCVLTVQTGINSPRYPALSMVLRARKKEIEAIPAAVFEKNGPGVALEKIQYPKRKKNSILLHGTIENKIEALLDILEKKALLM